MWEWGRNEHRAEHADVWKESAWTRYTVLMQDTAIGCNTAADNGLARDVGEGMESTHTSFIVLVGRPLSALLLRPVEAVTPFPFIESNDCASLLKAPEK